MAEQRPVGGDGEPVWALPLVRLTTALFCLERRLDAPAPAPSEPSIAMRRRVAAGSAQERRCASCRHRCEPFVGDGTTSFPPRLLLSPS
ncbi:hypothetical protein MTO96_007316 [Rhipicephalus appendiculatus]